MCTANSHKYENSKDRQNEGYMSFWSKEGGRQFIWTKVNMLRFPSGSRFLYLNLFRQVRGR